MKYRGTSTLVRTLLIVVFCAIPVVMSRSAGAQEPVPHATPAGEGTPLDSVEGAKPPLIGGVISAPPPIATPRSTHDDPELSSPGSPAAPTITVWYGATQTFGHKGDPQKWINILGRVNPVKPKLLTYSLNGGPHKLLNVGPDKRRLAEAGDFNIQLDYTDLLPGDNVVVIRATDSSDVVTESTVTVKYQGGGINWTPGTYIYDWSTASRIDDLAQVVDGQWIIDGGTVRPTVFAYDRLIAMGDLTWRDYTVTVPITFYGIDSNGYGGFSNGPGVGVMVRWNGHYYEASNGADPFAGWRRLGALGWYRWQRSGNVYTEGLQMTLNATNASSNRKLEFNTPYIFKLSVQSQANPSLPATYRFKVWEEGQQEPMDWDLVRTGSSGEPGGGGFLLLAHHVDAKFGAVTVDLQSVRPQPTLTVNTTGTGTGNVLRVPSGPYRFGEDVVLTATPDTGSTFVGWSGSLTGTTNPNVLEMFSNHSVTAVFNDPSVPLPVSDDFSDCALNTRWWTFVNPLNDASMTMNGSQLMINVPEGVSHDFWTNGQNAPRVMQAAVKQDFELDVKFDSAMSAKHQFQGVVVQANATNFLRYAFQHDGSTYRITAHTITNNTATTQVDIPITIAPSMYLRVKRVGDNWTLSYSSDGVNWTRITNNPDYDFTYALETTAMGVFAGNSNQNKAFTSVVDYFFNTASPINPEDNNRTLSLNSNGSGSITPTPMKSNYNCGETVQLQANPGEGYRFSSWSGDATGTNNPTTIIMNSRRTVTANFVPDGNYEVSIVKVGSGDVIKSPDKSSYDAGEQLTLTAIPGAGYQFAGWSGSLTGSQNPAVLNVNDDMQITATFTPILYTLQVSSEGLGGINVNPPGPQFAAGTQVQLTAMPANGYYFVRWEGDVQGSSNPVMVVMNGDKSVRAVFESDAPPVRSLYLPTVIR